MMKQSKSSGFLRQLSFSALRIVIAVIVILILLRPFVPTLHDSLLDILAHVGYTGENIRISGTGSMYPTFPKGHGDTDIARAHEIVALSAMKRFPGGLDILHHRYFDYQLQHGDIVSFVNNKTKDITIKQYGEEAGFVKRIIALPGDRIQIREGFVVLNGQRLKEPYTARPRSTFGGTYLPDCKEITIPQGMVFVMGDNRIGSSDSRHELELVAIGDIDHVLPLPDQKKFSANWRDPSGDDELVTQPTLDAAEYVRLLNDKRKEATLSALQFDNRLAASARKRGEVMLKYDDLSFEATRSGYTMVRAMNDAGYSNITWGEAPQLGYYTAEELIENSFQFPDTKKFLLQKDFQDIGVAAVLGQINGCPTQIVVQHFAGYVPPNYAPGVRESWQKALAQLQDVRPGWARLRDYTKFYEANKAEVDQILQVIDERTINMQKIVARMDHNQWLTREEQQAADRDLTLSKEQERLAKSLNSK